MQNVVCGKMKKRILVCFCLLWIVLSAGLFAETKSSTTFSYYLTDNLPYYDISLSVWFSENSDGSAKTNNADAKADGPSYYIVVSSGQAGSYDVKFDYGPFKLNEADEGFSDYAIAIRSLPGYEEVEGTSTDGSFSFSFNLNQGIDFVPGRKATKIYAVYYDLENANLLTAGDSYTSDVVVTVTMV